MKRTIIKNRSFFQVLKTKKQWMFKLMSFWQRNKKIRGKKKKKKVLNCARNGEWLFCNIFLKLNSKTIHTHTHIFKILVINLLCWMHLCVCVCSRNEEKNYLIVRKWNKRDQVSPELFFLSQRNFFYRKSYNKERNGDKLIKFL